MQRLFDDLRKHPNRIGRDGRKFRLIGTAIGFVIVFNDGTEGRFLPWPYVESSVPL